MRTICLSALAVFVALTVMMMIGRAMDQVHRDACTIEWSTDTGTDHQGSLCYYDTP